MTAPMDAYTFELPQVEIGDLITSDGEKRPCALHVDSTDAIGAGYGVDVDTTYALAHGWRPFVKLPASASGRFAGIVPRDAIKPSMTLVLGGYTANQIHPAQVFSTYRWGTVRVPLHTDNVSAFDPVYLSFSGSGQGKFRATSGGTQPVYLLTLTSTGSDVIGFSATIGGVTGASLTKTSGTQAADAAYLAAAWNGNAFYAAYGVATVNGSNNVVITGNALTAISFTDLSTVGNDIAPSTTTALVAATARLVPGAFWSIPTTAASGAGVAYFPKSCIELP